MKRGVLPTRTLDRHPNGWKDGEAKRNKVLPCDISKTLKHRGGA